MTQLHRVDIYAMINRAVREAGSQAQWATRIGVSPQYICDVLNGRRDPGPAILDAIGVERVEIYRLREPNA